MPQLDGLKLSIFQEHKLHESNSGRSKMFWGPILLSVLVMHFIFDGIS